MTNFLSIFSQKAAHPQGVKERWLSCLPLPQTGDGSGMQQGNLGALMAEPAPNQSAKHLAVTPGLGSVEANSPWPAAGRCAACTAWHTAAAGCQEPFWKCTHRWLLSQQGFSQMDLIFPAFARVRRGRGVSPFPRWPCSCSLQQRAGSGVSSNTEQAEAGASSSGCPFLRCWLSQTPSSRTPQMAN